MQHWRFCCLPLRNIRSGLLSLHECLVVQFQLVLSLLLAAVLLVLFLRHLISRIIINSLLVGTRTVQQVIEDSKREFISTLRYLEANQPSRFARLRRFAIPLLALAARSSSVVVASGGQHVGVVVGGAGVVVV